MSVQFGRWNLDGRPLERSYIERVKQLLAPYGPDDLGCCQDRNISIVHCAFHTTQESQREKQPHVMASGTVITWDGRLDNRNDLVWQLGGLVDAEPTDVDIVASAYERWGQNCFAKLLGDWAMSIWEPATRSLILAKDPIGVRHLYYSLENTQVTWSTVLDPLVLLAGRRFALCEEYIAGWFTYFPGAHLTPYVGIESLPPSCVLQIKDGRSILRKYWDFDPNKRTRYRSDLEYEEHFRTTFKEAVRRRLRSHRPVLAELSGGMDSSSIVCVADTIIDDGAAETPRLDTISYYDDSEPNWNERPYFAKVEEKRGRVGRHIDVSKREVVNFNLQSGSFAAIPGLEPRPSEEAKQFAEGLTLHGNRVVLSGIGGDEVMGGVPTPILELADLLARAHFPLLVHQLKLWALNRRVPWFHLFFTTARRFFPSGLSKTQRLEGPEAWLEPKFAIRNRSALGFGNRFKLVGPLPSFQGNLATLTGLQRQLSLDVLRRDALCEKQYPYLDRDLLEFMYAIPREQLVRPGRRRSLMRRALREFVPTEILERKRKAYVSRSPVVALQMAHAEIGRLLTGGLTVQYGLLDGAQVARLNKFIFSGSNIEQWPSLMKAIAIELWLRTQANYLVTLNVADNRQELAPACGADKARINRAHVWAGAINQKGPDAGLCVMPRRRS